MVRLLLIVLFLLWATRAFAYTCPTGPQQFYTATNPDTCATPSGVSPGGTAGGDLSGTYPNPTVAKENGFAFSASAPNQNNILIWEADGFTLTWQPALLTFPNSANPLITGVGGNISVQMSDLVNGTVFTSVGTIPVTSDAVTTDSIAGITPGAAGTVLDGQGINSKPVFGKTPVWEAGGSSAVVDTTGATNFFPFIGVAPPVASTSEGAVMTIATSSVFQENTMVCGMYNAAGTLTSPSPGTYTLAIRKNAATTTSTCTINSAARCVDSTHFQVFAQGDRIDYIVTAATAPVALIPKCSSQSF